MYGKGSVKSGEMNAHKTMAGAGSGGNFGVGKFPVRSVPHPDMKAKTGEKLMMDDSARAAPPAISAKGRLMQAAPDHAVGSGMKDHFNRDGKI